MGGPLGHRSSGMILRDCVLAGRIVGWALDGPELAAPAKPALELLLHFRALALLQRIGAAESKKRPSDREQDRQALHRRILENMRRFAIAECGLRIYTEQFVIRILMIPPDLLLQGYRMGVFPMAMEDGSIEWFSPDPRAILPLENFHVPHGLRRALQKKIFEIKTDNRFGEVIESCAAREDTWINREIIESYMQLHELGYAHSVEAWKAGKLAGGLYGVAIGGAFFGESMFHRATDASKIALVGLVESLRQRKFTLLDTQWLTPHLRQFGGIEIPRSQYLRLLTRAIDLPRKF